MKKIKDVCRRMDTSQSLDALLLHLNRMLRGWCSYFRPGVPSETFACLSHYLWHRVFGWLCRKHRRTTVKDLRRYCGGGWWPATGERQLFNPARVRTTRYRYRGAAIPSPWLVEGR
jgi:RNA-directed DNA polymerase